MTLHVCKIGQDGTTWQASHDYSLGDRIIPTTPNGYAYVCTTDSGSSAASEPSWGTTVGGTTSDGGITWTCHYGIRTQSRVVDIRTTEEFGHKDFTITVKNPTSTERQQSKGRIDDALIEIKRGSEDLIVGYIESTENGSDYVKYSGRSFLVLLGYSTSGETTSGGSTKAEYDGKTGAFIIDDLMADFCYPKDNELVYTDITFTETFGGEIKLHGKKVYQIVRDMCSMYGYDLWSDATWTGDNVTAKNIHIGTKSRGSSGVPHKTLTGGVEIANIPIIKYRTDADMVNAIRVMGKGTGKDRITAYYSDATSIAAYGTIEAEPFYSNMIADVDTALAVGQAIVDAKKEPVAQLHVDPAYYINDLKYGDWVKIIDSYSGINVTKRIKKITRSYSSQTGDSMGIELGEQFDNYENIVRNLTKGDVDPEPEMVKQGGALRLTVNTPPSDYVRHDAGEYYDTTGTFQEKGKGVCPFWTYAINPSSGYKKALIQISDAGAVSYKVGTQFASKTDAQNDSVSVDALNTPIGEVILKHKGAGGGGYEVKDVYSEDQENSYIYRDVRPIIGSATSGAVGAYLPLAGEVGSAMTGDLYMGGKNIRDVAEIRPPVATILNLRDGNGSSGIQIDPIKIDIFKSIVMRGGTISGNTGSGDDLFLSSTSHATKGDIVVDSALDMGGHDIENISQIKGKYSGLIDDWIFYGCNAAGDGTTEMMRWDASAQDILIASGVELDMNSNKITGLAAGTVAGNAVRYEQVLLLAGGTMAGVLNMGGQVLRGHTISGGGLTLIGNSVDAGYIQCNDELKMASNKITGLAAGDNNGDAVRFEQLGTGVSKILNAAGTTSVECKVGGDIDITVPSGKVVTFIRS